MRNLVIALSLLTTPCMAHATDKPPELAGVITANEPVGEASLRKLFMRVYDAAFWSDNGGWSNPPYALSITYAMGFTPDELAERTRDEMENLSTLPEETLTKYGELLRQLYPLVKDGDRITAIQKDTATTEFYHNGKKLGTIDDAGFAKPFFGIWLSPQSSEPDMQKKLTNAAH